MGGRNATLLCYFFMIKNLLIAGAIATAPISINNAVRVQTNTLNVTYKNYSQYYSDVVYDQNNIIDYATYLRYETLTPVVTGVGTLKQFIIQYNGIFNAEHNYFNRLYIYTLYENTANSTTTITYEPKGLINALQSNLYTSIWGENKYVLNAPTDQAIINMFNGITPTNYEDLEDIILTNPFDETPTTDSITVSNINDLTNQITLFNGNTLTYYYSVTTYYVIYDDIYPQTSPITDLYYFPNNATLNITYRTDAVATEQIVDIPGLMLQILGMPFAWISTAFNVTIFPGTLYEINISHILMALIVAGIVIFIIKKIFK